MIRPTVPSAERINARELAASRAQYAAEISRRAAASRRGLSVLGALAAFTVVVLALGLWGPISWAWTLLPGSLLVGAGLVAQRAGVERRAADARARARMNRLDQRLRLFRTEENDAPVAAIGFDEIIAGGAHSPRELPDEEPRHARVVVGSEDPEERGEATHESARETSADSDEGWTPVPVPVPTYTLKQSARRRSVSPYEADGAESEAGESDARVPERPKAAAPGRGVEEPVAETFNVNEVLARRRVAGM